jgi:hypothetical protein
MAEITKVWLVRDAQPDSEFFETVHEWPVSRLHTLIVGTGAMVWQNEHTKLYDDEASALKDAKKRWKKRRGDAPMNREASGYDRRRR